MSRAATEGTVFDIQRFALHDGPGIRTTVFLKGCPLRCVWCHNPESWKREPELSFRAEVCRDRLACADACAQDAHGVAGGRHVLDRDACLGCGTCVEACPHGALRLIGRRMSVDEVMQEVRRDTGYYASSGGGLTLSGGEPLAQPGFVAELLRAAHRSGLHTCLDTSGHAPERVLREVVGSVDLFLYDYKATDPSLHRELTGVGPERILANLDWLYDRGARIVLRCPLVPGVNDSPDQLAGIAALAARRPHLEAVEVLPYHDLGRDKAEWIGREPTLAGLPGADDQTVDGWLDELHRLGCERARRG